MRILHVSGTSTLSGANRYAFDLAAGQKDLGHEPIVAMAASPGTAFDFARDDVAHIRLGPSRALSFFAAAHKAKADIIHCHCGSAARWIRFMPMRPPAVMTLHIRFKKTMDRFEGVHMLADWQAPALSSFKGKIVKINNWTPTIAEADAAAIAEARALASASADDFLVVAVGRVESFVKGLDLLIDAVRSLPDPRLKVAIVGVGKDEAELRQRAAGDERIRFIGYSNTPAAWYGAADLVAMPSRREPFALVALEAMACRVPIVAAEVDGFGEMFENRRDCLVKPFDAAALADAIKLRAERKTAPGIVRDSYDMTRFDRRAGVAAVTRFYDEVISARQR